MFDDFVETMTRGDTHRIRFTVTINNVAEPITDWDKFWFTAKRHSSQPDIEALIALTTPEASGIDKVDPENGVLEVLIAPASTELIALGTHLRLVADLQGRDPNGDIFTLAKGTLVIEPDVTIGAT